MTFYKAALIWDGLHWSFMYPFSFFAEVGSSVYKSCESGGCVGSSKVFKLIEYDDDYNVTQYCYLCSNFDTLLSFWDGLLIGWNYGKFNRTIEFSRN